MKPQISLIHNGGSQYYLVVFDTLANRTRWFAEQGFVYDPGEHILARWVRLARRPYSNYDLECIPMAPEHCNEIRALCMKVTGHPVKVQAYSSRNLKEPQQ